MKLGTHNSMSYLPPKKWYLTPFKFMAKCQSLSIEEQYKRGARMFDIRVAFNKYRQIEIKHGLMAFKGNIYQILEYLNSLKGSIYIRLILESNKPDDIQTSLFMNFCVEAEHMFPKLKFFAGNRKCDWKVLYKFKTKDPNIEQPVSSMRGNKLDDLWPWLYAKLNNKKSREQYKGSKNWVLMDFIEL